MAAQLRINTFVWAPMISKNLKQRENNSEQNKGKATQAKNKQRFVLVDCCVLLFTVKRNLLMTLARFASKF
jgi:predicted ribosome-associated RNA-binding protein Tma20